VNTDNCSFSFWAEPDNDEPEHWIDLSEGTSSVELHLMYLAEKEANEN
jgi:hypothetical protein